MTINMGFLDKLQKRMSTSGADHYSEERFREAKPNLASQDPEDATRDIQPPLLANIEEEARSRRKKIYLATGIIAAVVLIAAGTAIGIGLYRAWYTVQPNMISIEIESPESILSGEEVTYRVVIQNESRVVWDDARALVSTPVGFSLRETSPEAHRITDFEQDDRGADLEWSIGTIRPGQSEELRISGNLIGEEGAAAILKANVSLVPSGKDERKTASLESAVRIDRVPIDVAIEVPRRAASGERLKIQIVYENKTAVDVTNARIVLTTPDGFSLDEMIPEPTNRDELYWDVDLIPQQGSGTIIVTGIIEGSPQEARPFTAEIGFVSATGEFRAQRSIQAATTIATRAISITQTHNGEQASLRVSPGEEVEGKIIVRNTGDVGLRDLIVETTIEGEGLDPETVSTEGFYNSTTNTIRWSPASIPQLEAFRSGESVELSYTFVVLPSNRIPCEIDGGRMAMDIQTVAESPDIPIPVGEEHTRITSGRFNILVNSVLGLDRDSFFDDGRAGLPVSTGPIPPRVGEQTVFTVRYRVSNTPNQVVDGVYRAVLPEGIEWLNQSYVTSGDISYNERTREVRWDMGVVAACASILLPGPEFAFQVGLTPSSPQIGEQPVLVRGSSIEGTDVFTGSRIRAEASAVTTADAAGRDGTVER